MSQTRIYLFADASDDEFMNKYQLLIQTHQLLEYTASGSTIRFV